MSEKGTASSASSKGEKRKTDDDDEQLAMSMKKLAVKDAPPVSGSTFWFESSAKPKESGLVLTPEEIKKAFDPPWGEEDCCGSPLQR